MEGWNDEHIPTGFGDEGDESIPGLDQLSLEGEGTGSGDGEEAASNEEDEEEDDGSEENDEIEAQRAYDDERYKVDGAADIRNIDFCTISESEFKKYHFCDLEVAYEYYKSYALMKGFAIRRSKYGKNKGGNIVRKTFLCYREGKRDPKYINKPNRKREQRPETRCNCKARMRVRFLAENGRWHVSFFDDEHNHNPLEDKYVGMLPGHRKMNESDILQMNNMREAGISTAQIYGSLAQQSGGFEKVGFNKQDMYNKLEKQKRMEASDARSTLLYLTRLRSIDHYLYWRNTVDGEGRLEHLFWCDGISQRDYEIFGDVLAFDATYRKNKYMCPLVVFSGVNHHNQTIVFGSALVANETEETYVWLLKRFEEAMKGKSPCAIITDGDLAMRNAIKRVFPDAYHRLCAWHLSRNATSNVKNPRFTSMFRNCMFGDYDIGKFERKWEQMVVECGVADNKWVKEIYEKRKMWAAAYTRGHFFCGYRTTSRCEGLHSHLGRYVHSRNNLTDFLHHYTRCLNTIRYKEVEADFSSLHGDVVLQTPLESLERSAANVYTREAFYIFREVLINACKFRVSGCKQTPSTDIHIVNKISNARRECRVMFYCPDITMNCSCQLMESTGFPCSHLVCVMVHLDISELPENLVLKRWKKTAKVSEGGDIGNGDDKKLMMARHGALLDLCRQLCNLACKNSELFSDEREKLTNEIALIEGKIKEAEQHGDGNGESVDTTLKNPVRVRSKGCSSSASQRPKRTIHCGICDKVGHNRKSCPEGRKKKDNVGDFREGCSYATVNEHLSGENQYGDYDQDDMAFMNEVEDGGMAEFT